MVTMLKSEPETRPVCPACGHVDGYHLRHCRIADLERSNAALRQWIHDLQSGMYINCVYCGHRYGPADKVQPTMQAALKAHIEQCPKHPMSALRAENKALMEGLSKMLEYADELYSKYGMHLELKTAIEQAQKLLQQEKT